MLDGLQLHFQGLGPFTRQDIFTLVGIVLHHLRDGLFVCQVTDDTRHIHEARKFAGLLAAVARHDFIPAVLTGTDDGRLGHALIPDAGHHSLHFLVITDLEGMIFEGVEFGQLDINNLFLLARAGSLGGSRRRFSLNGSLYLGRSLGGLGSLGGFLRFLAGSWFLCRLALLAGSLFLSGRSSFFLVCLGWTAPAFRGLGVFLLLGPGLLERSGRSRLFRGFCLLLGGGPLRGLLLGHDFREVKDRHAGGLLLLGSVCGLVLCWSLLCGSFGLIRGWSLGSGLLLLGNLCVHFGLGRGRARARPCCVSYDFCFFIGHSHFLLLI